MSKEEIVQYCLSKQGAYLDFPFAGDNYAVVKIANEKTGKNRIFAEIFELKGQDMLTFSTDSEVAIILRESYQDRITKGYHCPPVQAKYKSSLKINDFDIEDLQKFVDMSYDFAKIKLKLI